MADCQKAKGINSIALMTVSPTSSSIRVFSHQGFLAREAEILGTAQPGVSCLLGAQGAPIPWEQSHGSSRTLCSWVGAHREGPHLTGCGHCRGVLRQGGLGRAWMRVPRPPGTKHHRRGSLSNRNALSQSQSQGQALGIRAPAGPLPPEAAREAGMPTLFPAFAAQLGTPQLGGSVQ